jgi:hypothetical protein
MRDLRQGDMVRAAPYGEIAIVTANEGNFAIAVRTIVIVRPDEWDLVQNSSGRPPQ